MNEQRRKNSTSPVVMRRYRNSYKNFPIIFLVLLVLLIPAGQALLDFDEFTNDNNFTIRETIENQIGQVCTDCNASLWLNYPNGSLRNFSLMKYNSTSTKYDSKKLIPYLVNGNTTIYTIIIKANRTVSGNVYNAISDRTIITVYDIFPITDSQWDVALVIMLLVIQWTFVFLAYRFYDEHIMVKYGFIAVALFFNGWLLAIANRILAINGIITSDFNRLFESSNNLAIVLNFLFMGYIFIYLIYYMISSISDSARKVKGGNR